MEHQRTIINYCHSLRVGNVRHRQSNCAIFEYSAVVTHEPGAEHTRVHRAHTHTHTGSSEAINCSLQIFARTSAKSIRSNEASEEPRACVQRVHCRIVIELLMAKRSVRARHMDVPFSMQ